MGIVTSIKGNIAKSLLRQLTDGDKGSTVLGAAAAALLAANINFGLLFQCCSTEESGIELGKAIAVVVLGVWGYCTGKGKVA